MNRIFEVFEKPRVLLPVVHCCSPEQATTAIQVAYANGADGVFLIDQGGMDAREVIALSVRATYTFALDSSPFFIGFNLLSLGRMAIRHAEAAGAHGMWTDDAGIRENDERATARMLGEVATYRSALAWKGLYFGGVAFKYKASVAPANWGKVAQLAAAGGVDVVTTSGAATGEPPELEKIVAMREALGDHALAIASGITPENVCPFIPHTNAFLVASGIESSFGVFDPGKVRAVAAQVREWCAPSPVVSEGKIVGHVVQTVDQLGTLGGWERVEAVSVLAAARAFFEKNSGARRAIVRGPGEEALFLAKPGKEVTRAVKTWKRGGPLFCQRPTDKTRDHYFVDTMCGTAEGNPEHEAVGRGIVGWLECGRCPAWADYDYGEGIGEAISDTNGKG